MMEELAEKLINLIVTSNLVHAECVEDPKHDIVVVWSRNATEQISAFLQEVLRENV